MKLHLVIEHGKDATGIKKRVMWAQLRTDIKGMEQIDAVSELDEECVLGKEVTAMITDLLAAKKAQLVEQKKEIIKNKKKKK